MEHVRLFVKRTITMILLGLGWGALGYLLGSAAFGGAVLGGVMASPFIGVAIGYAFQPAAKCGTRARVFIALMSLYAASALFGTACGAYDLIRVGSASHAPLETVFQGTLAALWGLTFSGFFVFLWPLAYFSHTRLWDDRPTTSPGTGA